jgi:nicotinamide phosphoribosyltransferase
MTATLSPRREAVLNSYSRRLDKRLLADGRLRFNIILATDAYKFSHPFSYPKYMTGMYAYQEARTKGRDIMVPFGMQMLLWKTLANPITREDIEEAAEFCAANGTLFYREGWERILNECGGMLPVKIRTVREGTPVPSGNVIVTVEAVGDFFWLASYIETFLLRGIWYPTTIATNDRAFKKELKQLFEISGASMDMLVWMLNDFGARGVPAAEVAEIGGCAHMPSFMGSDTIEGIRAANVYYYEAMASFGVPATEHSIECSFGLDEEGEEEYLEHIITTLARPGGIVSIVIDGKDVYRATRMLCSPKFVELIKNCKAKIVLRPDSGDMMVIVPWILEQLRVAFGVVFNDKGYMKFAANVGVIQGDGIDMLTARSLIGKIVVQKYQADVIVLGSGGGLLQKVNRDTYKFAQKASAIRVDASREGGAERIARTVESDVVLAPDGAWIAISKDPVTDPGKQSKAGRVSLARNTVTGEFKSYDLDRDTLEADWEDALVTVYDCGVLYNAITLAEVRENVAV